MNLLTPEFLAKYPDRPESMNELATFVFYRTYSRWLKESNRRETWKEAVARAVDYNVSLGKQEFYSKSLPYNDDFIREEAEELFDNIFNQKQFLSGRTHWVGGADTKVADKFPTANFNCSFINIRKWDDLADLFYMLLVGTGVGFKSTKKFASELPPVRTDLTIIHKEYDLLPKHERTEDTICSEDSDGNLTMYVGDSKEGWVDALRLFLAFHYDESYSHINTVAISYNSIRPQGERLKTFGGTASGHLPLQEMFFNISKVFRNEIDSSLAPLESHGWRRVKVRPVHILDIGNLIGNNVVVGGVRRTAEIFLCDADDFESILAKYGINGIWNAELHAEIVDQLLKMGRNDEAKMLSKLQTFDANARPLHHRRMSNNSVGFTSKPSREMLHLLFTIMQGEGEPGFVNLYELALRRLKGRGITNPTEDMIQKEIEESGLNPCAEIALNSYGVCNLTTINVKAFVKNGKLKLKALLDAQRMSTRAGIRMTTVTLELPHWDATQKRDRLIGPSLTGWKDAMAMLGYDGIKEAELLRKLRKVAHEECENYSKELRIPRPLLATTVKPEGTLSQVAGGVSSGLHVSHAPYYIRRIRINAHDPLAKVAMSLNWNVSPEVGQTWENARTYVIDFPVKSGATSTRDTQTVDSQFDTYFMFQENYTDHNSSNTISVRGEEWTRTEEIVFDKWEDFMGVSFLAYDGGNYQLAPYEEITEAEYLDMTSDMEKFTPELLEKFEVGNTDDAEAEGEGCESGVCPIR